MAKMEDIKVEMDADEMVKALNKSLVAFGNFAVALQELSEATAHLKIVQAKHELTRFERMMKVFKGRGR